MVAPCHYFARGGCWRGSNCIYAHDTSSTKNPSQFGHELRGNAITFSPTPDSVLQAPAHPPHDTTAKKASCHFFLQGACRNGNLCRFSHDELNQEQISPIAASTGQSDLISHNVSIDEVTTQVCL